MGCDGWKGWVIRDGIFYLVGWCAWMNTDGKIVEEMEGSMLSCGMCAYEGVVVAVPASYSAQHVTELVNFGINTRPNVNNSNVAPNQATSR